jgi:molybdopterin converting factor small subunit
MANDVPVALLPTVTVVLPRALLRLFPGSVQEVTLSAATVGEMIRVLDSRWPGMGDRLCDSMPRIRRHLNVFVDGRRASLDTPLSSGARIFILTAMSGG